MELREQRDEALFSAYSKALIEQDFRSQSDAINYVRTHEAPKFFISPEFCAIVIGRLIRGEHPGVQGKQRIRKFKELYRLYLIEEAKPENKGASIRSICLRIVEMPAPEFYLNYRKTSDIINEQREKWQEYLASRLHIRDSR